MTYLILGASSDIGCELIKYIDENESNAVIYAHYNSGIDKLSKFGAKVIPVQADLSTEDGANKIIESVNCETIDRFIFLPAMKFDYMRVKDLDADKIKKEMQISVYSFLSISKALVPYMKKKENPAIFALLTKYVIDELPPKFMTDYIVTKYALLGAVKSLKAECGNKINVTYLAPDMIDTAFLSNLDEKIIEMNRMAAGGLLKAEDVARDIYKKL